MGLTPHSPPVKGTPAMSSKFPSRGATDLTTRGSRAASTPDKPATRGPAVASDWLHRNETTAGRAADSRVVRIQDTHIQHGEFIS